MTSVLPIQHYWHHAVNSQDKLNKALASIKQSTSKRQSIEADIIFSEIKKKAVMGHPPDNDGNLTINSFLDQMVQAQMQYSSNKCTNRIVKLDFKCMKAFESSIPHIQSYLRNIPRQFHHLIWINADILPGPGEDLDDVGLQLKMKPKFQASQFLEMVTQQLSGTTLSIGWTTSLIDRRAIYTQKMVDDMLATLQPYQKLNVTFPIRATSFRNSWEVMQMLYKNNWTVTLWWSLDVLDKKEIEWIYNTLEEGEEVFKNRTYYDLLDFDKYNFILS